MPAKNFISQLRKTSLISVLIFTMVLITSCVSKHEFLTSTIVPAARGYVSVKKDDNQNHVIRLEVNYLSEADRLRPSKETYVVWMVTKEDETKNLGQIDNTKKSAANNLKVSFETVSVYEPTRIFITAENDPTTAYPGTQIVLSTGRINK
jgi:ABC-type Fe3+-citrate transport system substrate-binding protein